MGGFTTVQVLDETRNSSIFCLRERRSGRLVAGKRAQKNLAQSEENHRNEVRMLRSLNRCEGVVRLLGVCENTSELWIILELYGGGNLEVRLDRFPSTARDCAWQFLDAVESLHFMKIVHLDLKPTNVLFNDSGRLQLCDFATARRVETPGQLLQGGSTRGNTGIDFYKAPEVCSGKPYCPFKADIFSAGKTLQFIAKADDDGTWFAASRSFSELASRLPERRPTLAAIRAAVFAGGYKRPEAEAPPNPLEELLLELAYEPWAAAPLPPFGLAVGAKPALPHLSKLR
jgi:serine/threonine protein kinase